MAVARIHPATGIDHAAESAKHFAIAREHDSVEARRPQGRAWLVGIGNMNRSDFRASLGEFHHQMAKRRTGYLTRAAKFLAAARRKRPFDRGEYGSGELALECAERHYKRATAYERKKATTPAREKAKARPRRVR